MAELKMRARKLESGDIEVGFDIASLIELFKNLMPFIQMLMQLFMSPPPKDDNGPNIDN